MNASELDLICSVYENKIKNYFRGVFSKTEFENHYLNYCIPDMLNIFIVNSQNDYGAHWLLFSVNKSGKNIFFDSFGKTPDYYNFKIAEKNWEMLNFRCQSLDSQICGLYCIFVAFWICMDKTLNHIAVKFLSKEDLKQNDALIIQFIKNKHYGEALLKNNSLIGRDRAFKLENIYK